MTLTPGTRVRARRADPDHHTRLPAYVRGQTGAVVEVAGQRPLPDDRARGVTPPRVETVYSVRFPAAGLWERTHSVVVDLWETYLEEAG